jgi:carboxylesterase type B
VVPALQERWARFVIKGNPATKTEPWPQLDLENPQLLEFSDTGEFVRENFAGDRLDLAAAMPRIQVAR